jgi:hypothetical protein
MSVEEKQIKNLRNRALDFVRVATPEKLIRFAIYLKIKVPNELIIKYTKKGVTKSQSS